MSYEPASGYEHVVANNTTRRGPLRFEEGIPSDTDVPREFGKGAYEDTGGDGRGRPFTNAKSPGETTAERAHHGSASWIEAPEMLSEFVQGASNDHTSFERRTAVPVRRIAPTVVSD